MTQNFPFGACHTTRNALTLNKCTKSQVQDVKEMKPGTPFRTFTSISAKGKYSDIISTAE